MSQPDRDFQALFIDEDNDPKEMVWILWKFLTDEQKIQAIKRIKHEAITTQGSEHHMPYLSEKSEGAAAKRQARETQPFGPGFPESIASVTEKMEVWASSFKDVGGDYCEFRAFDAQGKPLGTRRVNGY